MPWNRPTLKQLFERISQDFSGRLLDGGAVLSRSVIAVFSKVWAGAAHALHSVLAWIFLQVFVDTAEGPYLERWARIWGLYHKGPDYAAGNVIFAGNNGAVIPAGTLFLDQSSQEQYAAQADAVIKGGLAAIPIKAVNAGTAANLPAGASISLVAPLAGVRSGGQVDDGGLTGGVEAENNESLRGRLLARLRKPPRGGSKSDYEAWALEVPGVTRAWCYPMGLGIGTVSLAFVTDNAPGGPIPSLEMVRRVQEYIEPLRPATVKEWLAFAPEPLPMVIRLAVRPDTAAVREAVRAELNDLIAREGLPGAALYRSHINEAVSLASGEVDHTLFEPAADIEVPGGYFPILESIIFTDANGNEKEE